MLALPLVFLGGSIVRSMSGKIGANCAAPVAGVSGTAEEGQTRVQELLLQRWLGSLRTSLRTFGPPSLCPQRGDGSGEETVEGAGEDSKVATQLSILLVRDENSGVQVLGEFKLEIFLFGLECGLLLSQCPHPGPALLGP